MKTLTLIAAAVLFIAAAAALPQAQAKSIDLVTVPPRDSVQLTIYNSEDLTLVRETRSLSLKKGANRIQYSWAGTLIDPTSVEIRPVEKADMVEVLDTTYPGDRPQQLVWNIDSQIEGQVRFQVTYFTSGLSWKADYVLVANQQETMLDLDGYVEILNNSGEDYDNAQVRLVVGVVNLVEKITELARRGVISGKDLDEARREAGKMRRLKAIGYMEAVVTADYAAALGARPAEIIKEGLSEYFIYTVEGHQTVPNGWSKRLASFAARQAKFDILYRLRPHQYGPRPVKFYMLKNDTEHKLGTTPLPDGLVRTFRDNGRDGLSFLGQQHVKYVPIKEDIELNLGTDDEVVEELIARAVKRSRFTFDRHNRVHGWDEARDYRDEVRNYHDKPIRMEVRRVIHGDVEFTSELANLHDFHTVAFTVDVKPRETFAWEYRYVQRLGKNARQNEIILR